MTNTERIQAHNAELRECIELAENLPDAGTAVEIVLQDKTITPTKSEQKIKADADYTGLNEVTVEPIPNEYIIPSGTLDVTENGTYDVTEKAEVVVNVESSGGGVENHLDKLLDGSITAIDSDVSKIIAYACYGITTLKTVNLPNATTSGGYSFRGCSGLTSVNAPNLATIGSYMFYGCSSLTEVNFPKATSVSSTSFYQCTKLEKADFAVAKSISSSAFAYCTKLKTLILRRSDAIVTVATNSFDGVTTFAGYVYVPKALIEDYKNYTNWATKFADKFRAIEDYPDICGG